MTEYIILSNTMDDFEQRNIVLKDKETLKVFKYIMSGKISVPNLPKVYTKQELDGNTGEWKITEKGTWRFDKDKKGAYTSYFREMDGKTFRHYRKNDNKEIEEE